MRKKSSIYAIRRLHSGRLGIRVVGVNAMLQQQCGRPYFRFAPSLQYSPWRNGGVFLEAQISRRLIAFRQPTKQQLHTVCALVMVSLRFGGPATEKQHFRWIPIVVFAKRAISASSLARFAESAISGLLRNQRFTRCPSLESTADRM